MVDLQDYIFKREVTPMAQTSSCSLDKLNLLRQLADREHHLLNDRNNIFLIWHSILMAGFALGRDFPQLVTILPLLGFASSLIWLYVGHRSIIVADYFWKQIVTCESSLPENERVYTNAQNWRGITHPPILGIPVTMYFARFLPGLWAATWLVLLVWRA